MLKETTIERLRLVRDAILAHPEQFNMRLYFCRQDCGTAACIGGWAVTLSKGKDNPADAESQDASASTSASASVAAREWLGLTYPQADTLFHVSSWPLRLAVAYRRYESRGEWNDAAQIAANRIGHFIETGGEE